MSIFIGSFSGFVPLSEFETANHIPAETAAVKEVPIINFVMKDKPVDTEVAPIEEEIEDHTSGRTGVSKLDSFS